MYRPPLAEEKFPVPDRRIEILVNHLNHLKASEENIHEIKSLLSEMAELYTEVILFKLGDCAGKVISTVVLLYFPLSPMVAGLLSATGYWLTDILIVKGGERFKPVFKRELFSNLCKELINEIPSIRQLSKQNRKHALISAETSRIIKNLMTHLKIRNKLMRDAVSIGDDIHLRAMLGTFVGASTGAACASHWVAKSATNLLFSFAAGRLSWHLFWKPSTIISGGQKYVISQADKDATIKPIL
jgi:hypothetical protein